MVNRVDTPQAPSLTATPKVPENFGLGLIVDAYFADYWSAEMALLFADYQFIRDYNGQLLSETVNRVHVPILVKYSFLTYFSLGLGFYGSYRMGEVKSLTSPMGQNGLQTSASDSGEHGLEGSFQLTFPLFEKYFLTLNIRHSYSLTPRTNEERNYQNLLLSLRKLVN